MAVTNSNAFNISVVAPVTGLPSWVPSEGTFANISLNTVASARPSGWPSTEPAGPFANWSGGVFASGFGARGAYVVHGSGHLAQGTPVWAGVWCFDLDTRLWVGRNVPAAPLLEITANYNSFGESNQGSTVGHPYAPHTYDGLVYQSTTLGGTAPAGNLIRISQAGGPFGSPIHQFNLNSATSAPTRVVDAIGGTSYPAAALDEGRGGLWYLSANGNGPLKFVNLSTWAVTTIAGVDYNEYGNHSLIYLPAPYDCLLGMGSSGSGGVNLGMYVSRIVAGVPQQFTQVAFSGTPPADRRCGGVWSTLLSKVVSYQAAGSTTVHKCTPPGTGAALTSGTWAWSSETLSGVAGATPSRNTTTDNGSWGRFIEAPDLRCFIWCDSVTGPVQAWRLMGM